MNNQFDAVPGLKALGIVWNKVSKRFADVKSGRFLSQSKAVEITQKAVEDSSNKLNKLAEDLAAKKIQLDVFAVNAASEVKKLQIYNTAIAKGGRLDDLSKSELEALNKRIKQQLGSTVGFQGERYGIFELVKEISKGDVSESQLKNRLSMYVSASHQTQDLVILESKKVQGLSYGMRVLAGDDKSCPECRSMGAEGWKPIDQITPIGSGCSCRSRCRCKIVFK